jgi:hypothetical protein
VLRREVAEMCDRVQLLEKASRQLELDNERLAFKVNTNACRLPPPHTQFNGISIDLACIIFVYCPFLFCNK